MIKKKIFSSLRVQFLAALLAAVALGFGCAAATKTIGDTMINDVYMSEKASEDRCKDFLDAFNTFVQENDLKSSDSGEVIKWARAQHYIYLIVSRGESVLVDSGWWDEGTSAYNDTVTEETDATTQREDELRDTKMAEQDSSGGEEDTGEAYDTSESEIYGIGYGTRPVRFQDGTYTVSVYDFTETNLFRISQLCSYGIGLLVFLILMLCYHQSTIRQIIKLSQEVKSIASGDLEHPITIHHQNEIGMLARDVDSMRHSIVREMHAEEDAWNANRELITSMSHDVRTPLTVLLGFLELMEEGGYSEDPAYCQYLDICKKNAFQIKNLTDTLFRYFRVFGNAESAEKMENVDIVCVTRQMVGEQLAWLQEKEWKLQTQDDAEQCFGDVSVAAYKRVFDNVFSNIEKYGDPAYPIHLHLYREGEQVFITVTNTILATPNPVESTNIGLKSCDLLMRRMNGTFRYKKDSESGQFEVKIGLPVTVKR